MGGVGDRISWFDGTKQCWGEVQTIVTGIGPPIITTTDGQVLNANSVDQVIQTIPANNTGSKTK